MILTLDVGNSRIHGGLFEGSELKFEFRKDTRPSDPSNEGGRGASKDELGVFLRGVIRENGFDPVQVEYISMCSVVPDLTTPIRSACLKYFGREPFLLSAQAKTDLNILYDEPSQLGTDRLAAALAVLHLYPARNVLIVDFGTATTCSAITKDKDYLGGLIFPGFRISMEALEQKTSQLPRVDIVAPKKLIGTNTIACIQSGLYFSSLYGILGITAELKKQYFKNEECLVIGTGGFSKLFENRNVFDHRVPSLLLYGLNQALRMNI